jgi:hypothetical protein
MTDGLATAVLALTAVVIVIAIGLIWWVVRPDAAARGHHDHHDERRVIPLFGVDLLGESVREDDAEDGGAEDGTEDERPLAPAARPSPARGAAAVIDRHAPADPDGHQQIFGDRRFAPQPRSAEPASAVSAAMPNGNGNGKGHGVDAAQPTATGAAASGRSHATELRGRQAALTAPAGVPTIAAPRGDSQAIRFQVPTDGTLQFLPGRLEVEAGGDLGREIRFVRTAGPDGSEVTFGRSEGELYRHVQLNDQTVSRMHARMRMRDGQWHLTNHSTTNPLSLNGHVLGIEEEQPLGDGDRIEMGEVIFRFRSR